MKYRLCPERNCQRQEKSRFFPPAKTDKNPTRVQPRKSTLSVVTRQLLIPIPESFEIFTERRRRGYTDRWKRWERFSADARGAAYTRARCYVTCVTTQNTWHRLTHTHTHTDLHLVPALSVCACDVSFPRSAGGTRRKASVEVIGWVYTGAVLDIICRGQWQTPVNVISTRNVGFLRQYRHRAAISPSPRHLRLSLSLSLSLSLPCPPFPRSSFDVVPLAPAACKAS